MNTARYIKIHDLSPKAVLLVDTENALFKLIVGRVTDQLPMDGKPVIMSELAEDDTETDMGIFFISDIKVGKPIYAVRVPERGSSGALEISDCITTAQVKNIEIYE